MERWIPVLAAPLCLLLLAPPLASQDVELTVLAGLSSATHTGDGAETLDFDARRTGPVVGAGLSVALNPNLAVGLQALYTAKGSKDDFFDDTLELDYLELPLLLIVSFPVGDAGTVRPMVMAGPALGIKLRARFVEDGVSYTEEQVGQDYRSTDFGVALGGGVGIAAGRGQVLVLGRYVGGLQDAHTGQGVWALDGFKNQSLQAMVGYSFPIGGLGR